MRGPNLCEAEPLKQFDHRDRDFVFEDLDQRRDPP